MEDLISRQDAINAVSEVDIYDTALGCSEVINRCLAELEALPSAETTGELDNAIQQYIKDGFMKPEIPSNSMELSTKWIPCSERLPEEGTMVLTTIRGHDVINVRDGETLEDAIKRIWNEVCYTSVGFIDSDGWYGADGFPAIVRPDAWRPLPEPYKG